jgi:hypothetical protein
MVGTSPPFGLCSFSRERHCSVDVKTISELRISATQHDEKGWMPKNHLFLQQREKCFLLTSPFIEPRQYIDTIFPDIYSSGRKTTTPEDEHAPNRFDNTWFRSPVIRSSTVLPDERSRRKDLAEHGTNRLAGMEGPRRKAG